MTAHAAKLENLFLIQCYRGKLMFFLEPTNKPSYFLLDPKTKGEAGELVYERTR